VGNDEFLDDGEADAGALVLGTSGQLGAMVKNTPQALVDRLMLVCSCCGRVGSACEAGAAAATPVKASRSPLGPSGASGASDE
jgi:hypothetical protein